MNQRTAHYHSEKVTVLGGSSIRHSYSCASDVADFCEVLVILLGQRLVRGIFAPQIATGRGREGDRVQHG